jgi:hypothetical protein
MLFKIFDLRGGQRGAPLGLPPPLEERFFQQQLSEMNSGYHGERNNPPSYLYYNFIGNIQKKPLTLRTVSPPHIQLPLNVIIPEQVIHHYRSK